MAATKSVPEKITELYAKKPVALSGAPEVKNCWQFIESLHQASGFGPKSKEAEIYIKAIAGLGKIYDLLARTNEGGIDFSAPAVQQLVKEASNFIVENWDNPDEGENCKVCKKLIGDAKTAPSVAKTTKSNNSTSEGATEEDHKILEAFVASVGIPEEGINKGNIPELLQKAFDNPDVENVKNQIKKSLKIPSLYVGSKPYRFDLVAKSCIKALKESVNGDSPKYVKVGHYYKKSV